MQDSFKKKFCLHYIAIYFTVMPLYKLDYLYTIRHKKKRCVYLSIYQSISLSIYLSTNRHFDPFKYLRKN